jgi:death-on-curing protein
MRREPRWLDQRALLFLQEESLATFGGASGVRDQGLLESALARPVNKFLHDNSVDLAELAAAYGYGLCRNHAFVDGNKRVAFLAVGLFLAINGKRLAATNVEAIRITIALAAGEVDEPQLADWIRSHMRKR